jgi:ubiquinone/menaquinone biosynthesis C-methylase UbiE
MLKPFGICKTIRNWCARYNVYRRAYSNSPDWPLVLWLRKPLFKSTAVASCQYLAQGTVLDIGTGPGSLPRLLVEIAPNIRVIGTDIERVLLQDARKSALQNPAQNRISFLLADAHALPFFDGSFDMVVSVASLHLLHDRQKAITESYRVLKHEGIALVLVGMRRIYPGKMWLLDFVTNRSAKHLKLIFETAGFKEIQITNPQSSLLRVVGRK